MLLKQQSLVCPSTQELQIMQNMRLILNDVINNNNNNLIYIAPACRMTSEAKIDAVYRGTYC